MWERCQPWGCWRQEGQRPGNIWCWGRGALWHARHFWHGCWSCPAHGASAAAHGLVTAPANPLPRLQPCFCCHLRPELHEGFKSSLLLKETQGLLSPFFNQWGLSSFMETWAVGLSQAGSKLAGKIIDGVWSESSLLDVFLVCIHDSCVSKKTDFDGNLIISNSILKSLFKAAARQGVADELYINNSQHRHSSFCLCVWDIYCCALSSTWNKTWWKIISYFRKGVLLGLVRARIIIYSQKNTSRQCSWSYGSSVWWLLVCV